MHGPRAQSALRAGKSTQGEQAGRGDGSRYDSLGWRSAYFLAMHVSSRAQPILFRFVQCTPARLSSQYRHRVRLPFFGLFRPFRLHQFLKPSSLRSKAAGHGWVSGAKGGCRRARLVYVILKRTTRPRAITGGSQYMREPPLASGFRLFGGWG